jgi:hypothetical protein
MSIRCTAVGCTKENTSLPKRLKGRIIVNKNAPKESKTRIPEGLAALKNTFFVRMEKRNMSSVIMLAINQFVCNASGEIL